MDNTTKPLDCPITVGTTEIGTEPSLTYIKPATESVGAQERLKRAKDDLESLKPKEIKPHPPRVTLREDITSIPIGNFIDIGDPKYNSTLVVGNLTIEEDIHNCITISSNKDGRFTVRFGKPSKAPLIQITQLYTLASWKEFWNLDIFFNNLPILKTFLLLNILILVLSIIF